MRRGTGQVGRVWLGVAALAGALALGGCGMTPRDQFFHARSVTFKSAPGTPGAGSSGIAGGAGASGLASSLGVGR